MACDLAHSKTLYVSREPHVHRNLGHKRDMMVVYTIVDLVILRFKPSVTRQEYLRNRSYLFRRHGFEVSYRPFPKLLLILWYRRIMSEEGVEEDIVK
jgi:hypothetical protein